MLRAYTTQGDVPSGLTYNLYWGDEESSDDQMMLGMENLAATSVVHNSNDNLRYNVTAMVDGRETDFSNTIYLGPSVDVQEVPEPEDDCFAYVSNEGIIINGNGTVQVIDILGRQVFSHKVNSAFSIQHSEFTPGMYVLRLVNGTDVKTQKIMLR